MGGPGSGNFSWRRPSRNLVEHAFVLDVANLAREGRIPPGTKTSGRWQVFTPTGGNALTLSYESDLTNLDEASIRLSFHLSGIESHQRVRFAVTSPRFGGVRMWFMCPVTGRRARVLYLLNGSRQFASREAHGLCYRSQGESGLFRSITQAQNIRARLGGSLSVYAPFPPRPCGMHQRTYERLRTKALAIEAAAREALLARDSARHSRLFLDLSGTF
jgi:hypothetical protein